MARLSKKQEQTNEKAFENAKAELKGATIHAQTVSFSLDYNGRIAIPFQMNGAVLVNDSEQVDLMGAETEDGIRKGGMQAQAQAYMLDAIAEAMPWLMVDTFTIQSGKRLFSVSTFADAEKDENGEPKADPKNDAKKRAIKRLLTTEGTAARIIEGAKRAGGKCALDALHKKATSKKASDTDKRNYIYACWNLGYAPAFNSTVATAEGFAMWSVKPSDFKTIDDYARAMKGKAAYIAAGEFENGQHKPEA